MWNPGHLGWFICCELVPIYSKQACQNIQKSAVVYTCSDTSHNSCRWTRSVFSSSVMTTNHYVMKTTHGRLSCSSIIVLVLFSRLSCPVTTDHETCRTLTTLFPQHPFSFSCSSADLHLHLLFLEVTQLHQVWCCQKPKHIGTAALFFRFLVGLEMSPSLSCALLANTFSESSFTSTGFIWRLGLSSLPMINLMPWTLHWKGFFHFKMICFSIKNSNLPSFFALLIAMKSSNMTVSCFSTAFLLCSFFSSDITFLTWFCFCRHARPLRKNAHVCWVLVVCWDDFIFFGLEEPTWGFLLDWLHWYSQTTFFLHFHWCYSISLMLPDAGCQFCQK